MVKRRTVVGTAIVGGVGLALAYLFYGKDGIPEIIPKATTTTTPSTVTTTPGKPTTTPITTTTTVTEIPTTIAPPQKPENMLTPYLAILLDPTPEPLDPTYSYVYVYVANQGTVPSFATYIELYNYSLESGYALLGRKQITLQPGQREYVEFLVKINITAIETPTPTEALHVRVMDPIFDPLREPIEERSRKVAWYTKLPNELLPP